MKSETVKTRLDISTLQSENKVLHLQLKECEGTIVKLNSTVQKIESKVESLQIYSMKTNLMLHNIPEAENEDCYAVVNAFLQNDLKIPSSLLFTQENPCGDIRVDIVHRVGQKRDKPRSLIVKFTSHRGRDLVLSHSRNLKASPYAVSEHLPPAMRERRAAQIPLLIEKREEAKANHNNSRIKLVGDKLMINSNVNTEAFEKNRLETISSVKDPIPFENMLHSNPVTLKGSSFQGHLYPVHTMGEAVQALRSLSQDESSINSDHAMYAYNFTDPEGNNRSGYYDDGEWKGSTVLSSILEDRKLSDVILIVTRKFGGVFLGKKRFQLIKKAAAEVLNLYTP